MANCANLKILSLLVAVTIVVESYPYFRDRIPNGHNIPNPCLPDKIWNGVGHINPNGGGTRNTFGVDFDQAGRRWTMELCMKDSDGDGRSNGVEVGDPECVWTEGKTPAITDKTKLSHPGVCEPVGSEQCLEINSFLESCSGLVNN